MFLATTALTEYWDKEQELLILGAWCLRYDRRHEWETLKCQVMPCPWDDRKRFHDAADYLDEVAERMLVRLAEYLNAVHKVSYGSRYWRLLVGPWLILFVHAVYDRYVLLSEAFRQHAGLRTIVLDPQSYGTPRDTLQTYRWMDRWDGGDRYNLQLFSQLLALMGYSFPTRVADAPLPSITGKRSCYSHMKRLVRKGGRLVGQGLGRLVGTKWEVALCDTYFSWRHTAALVLRSNFRALPLETSRNEWPFSLPAAVWDERRHNLARLHSSDPFEELFVQLLPHNFPTLYLEGYQQARNTVLRENRRIPSVIASAVGWGVNEPFKFLAAEAAAKGARLVTIQHGGAYGVLCSVPTERHEFRIGDRHILWGWADPSHPHCLNVPFPLLSNIAKRGGHANRLASKLVLYLAATDARYVFRFQSMPVAGQWRDYFVSVLRFVSSVPDTVRPNLMMRPHPDDYWNEIKPEISSRYPEVQWDDHRPLFQRLRTSRIVVVDHCLGVFLEVLAANVPTILFWDRHRWELREEAEPYFDELRKVGILWDSPEAAALKLAEVYDSVEGWWSGEVVQDARRRFADRYALARHDWVESWSQALKEEIARG